MMNTKTKRKIKKHLAFLIPIITIPRVSREYFRYLKYSGVLNAGKEEKLIGSIIAKYHVVEKGLSMPEIRLGFGENNLEDLIEECLLYKKKYGLKNPQVRQGIAIILEYKDFHKEQKYQLPEYLLNKINKLEELRATLGVVSHQKKYTREEYLKDIDKSFDLFSESRRSIRNYSQEDIPVELLRKAIGLAQNTPSACNRQAARVHLISDNAIAQEVLRIQSSNRGFGHLANKVIVVTSELGVYHGLKEKNADYVDGGMFAMNLLYSLHYYGIGACSLNCSLSKNADKKIKQLCNIKNSETLILIISCGLIPEELKVASSVRYPLDHILSEV